MTQVRVTVPQRVHHHTLAHTTDAPACLGVDRAFARSIERDDADGSPLGGRAAAGDDTVRGGGGNGDPRAVEGDAEGDARGGDAGLDQHLCDHLERGSRLVCAQPPMPSPALATHTEAAAAEQRPRVVVGVVEAPLGRGRFGAPIYRLRPTRGSPTATTSTTTCAATVILVGGGGRPAASTEDDDERSDGAALLARSPGAKGGSGGDADRARDPRRRMRLRRCCSR